MSIFQKPKIHNHKSHIPRILLSLALFLIIFMTQFNSNTLTAKAAEFTGQGTKWETWPDKIYWGGSADKQGVIFYLYNIQGGYIESGAAPFAFVASYQSNGEPWQAMSAGMGSFQGRLGCVGTDRIVTRTDFPYPATYTEDGTWVSTGGDTKAYLEEELSNGRQRWETIIAGQWGEYWVERIKEGNKNAKNEKYRICIESISAFVPYINYQNSDGENVEQQMKKADGEPCRIAVANRQAAAIFAAHGVDIRLRYGSNGVKGTANSKWLQSIATGMIFTDEEEAKLLGGKVALAQYSGEVLTANMLTEGYGFGTIKPTITPIHTCNGHTPGDPEEPDPNKGTDGKCTIQKLYWTTYYDKDGNFLRRSPAINKQRSGTTNYIVIDSEPGYTVRKWSTNSGSISQTPTNWKSYTGIHNGKGGGEIVLNEEGGEKYLAVWLEKIEVDEKSDENKEDFILYQSQVTRRISFQDPDNPSSFSKMQTLMNNTFTVKAPGVRECSGHFTCTDTSTGHEHSDYPDGPCWEFCSGASWPDNGTKIGIQNTMADKAPSILSRHQQTTTSMKGDTISDTGNTKDNLTNSRTGTGEASLSYSGYRYNCIIFRGKDQLVLADWKNAQVGGEYLAAKSFLGNIAINGYSQYNFKSANQPNGTRYKGDFYYEEFKTNFEGVSGEEDKNTSFRYLNPAKGSGHPQNSSYRFDPSTVVKINVIVKVEVYWGYKDKTKSDLKAGSAAGGGDDESNQNLYAGSVGFYPYILMRYDTKAQRDQHVFVMGEFPRSIKFYDAASYSIDKTGTDAITLLSSQWSTHASAISGLQKIFDKGKDNLPDKMKESILPGGATLSLSIAKDAVRKVTVTTAQAYLPTNSAGYKQMMNTMGSSTTKLPTSNGPAKAAHSAFANAVRSAFQRTYIKQYVSTEKSAIKANNTASILNTGKAVHAGDSFNGLKLSTDSKYYFNKYNESHLDVSELHHSESTVTFGIDSHGELWYTGGVPSSVPHNGLGHSGAGAQYILDNTDVENQMKSGLLTKKGADTNCPWGTQWYNEAFDGVTYIYQQDYFYVGLINPTERITVIDPKLTPKQNSKSDFFNNFHSSAFITFNPSNKLGTFRNAAGSGKSFTYNFNNLYRSKPFYIPNVTTQDLN